MRVCSLNVMVMLLDTHNPTSREEMRKKVLEAAEKRRQMTSLGLAGQTSHVLGGDRTEMKNKTPAQMAVCHVRCVMMLQYDAAERRRRDEQWCGTNWTQEQVQAAEGDDGVIDLTSIVEPAPSSTRPQPKPRDTVDDDVIIIDSVKKSRVR